MPRKTISLIETEVKEVGLMLRHYSSLRFVVLTVFFGFLGGAITIISTLQQQQTQEFYLISAKIGGLLATITFWFFENRFRHYIGLLEHRAAELEKDLGFKVYSNRSKVGGYVPWITNVLYGSVFIFWIVALFI